MLGPPIPPTPVCLPSHTIRTPPTCCVRGPGPGVIKRPERYTGPVYQRTDTQTFVSVPLRYDNK